MSGPWTDGDLLTPDNLNNKGIGKVLNLRDYGGLLDGSTDDTTALVALAAAGVTQGLPVYIGAGSIVTTGWTPDTSGRLTVLTSGTQSTIFRYSGSNGGSCIHLTKERTQILGGFSVAPLASQTVTGLLLDGSASRCVVSDYPLFNGCDIAIKIDGVYGNELTADIGNGLSKGIHFTSTANANRVQCQEVDGTTVAGSIGIDDDGNDNETSGQQLSGWETPIAAAAGVSHNFTRHFIESCTNGGSLASGSALVFNAYDTGVPFSVADGAAFITPFGFNHPNGAAHMPIQALPLKSLSVYYPVHDSGTTILQDFSGNGRTGTKNGAWASAAGPYGYAIRLATGGYNTIRLPVASLTYNGAWAVAVLCKHVTWGAADTNIVFKVFENSNTVTFSAVKDTYNTAAAVSGGPSSGNLTSVKHITDVWEWVCVGYDGTSVAYNLHPSMLTKLTGQSVTGLTNPLTTTPTEIEVGGNQGTMDVGAVAVWNGRIPSKTEMLHWCNQATPPLIPAAARTIGGNETTGATSVADGGTVTHGLGTTPTVVTVTPSTTGEFVSVTALAATTFTVAIKKHDNSAGTTQTVYWRAIK